MSILSGFIKARAYKKTADGYKWESRDTHSDTVIMPDGNTATTNIGKINGITDSLASTSSNFALSAKAGNELNNNLATLRTSFQTGCSTIANKITSCGVTTATNASPATMATNIQTIYTNRYNAGITAADARVNTSSASYSAGYNTGCSAGSAINIPRWGVHSNGDSGGYAQLQFNVAGKKTLQVYNYTKSNNGVWTFYNVRVDGNLIANNNTNNATYSINGSLLVIEFAVSGEDQWSSMGVKIS